MIEKVKVSKAAAEVIESLIDLASTSSIGYVITEFEKNEYKDKRIDLMREMFDTPTFIKVLVFNEYEVEQTPEEKIQEYFKILRRSQEEIEQAELNEDPIPGFSSEQTTVINILNMLGLKIKGVNV